MGLFDDLIPQSTDQPAAPATPVVAAAGSGLFDDLLHAAPRRGVAGFAVPVMANADPERIPTPSPSPPAASPSWLSFVPGLESHIEALRRGAGRSQSELLGDFANRAAAPVRAGAGLAQAIGDAITDAPRAWRAGGEEMRREADLPQSELWRNFANHGRSMVEGVSLGLSPRFEALVRGAAPGHTYTGELENVLAERARHHATYPGRAATAEFAGGFATPFFGARALLGEAPSLARMAGVGAGIGATTAGVTAAAHTYGAPDQSYSDVLAQQVAAAPVPALVGGIGGAFLAPLVSGGMRGVGMAGNTLRRSGQAANEFELIAEAANRDRLQLANLADNLPRTVSDRARKLTSYEDIAAARRMLEEGRSRADVAQAFNVSERVLGARLATDAPVPMNILELANVERPGSGANLTGLVRAGARIPGESKAIAFERLTDRQMQQQGRLADLVRTHFGSQDFAEAQTALANNITRTNDALYNTARLTDAAQVRAGVSIGSRLQPILDGLALRYQYMRDPVATEVRRVIDAFRPSAGNPRNPASFREIQTLDEFLQANEGLQALLTANKANPAIYRRLAQLRDDIHNAVRAHNPDWGVANQTAAEGFSAQRALELGRSTAIGSTDPREIARAVAKMSPDAQQLYRLGLGEAALTRLSKRSPEESNSIVRTLRLPIMRQVYETVLGKANAQKFLSALGREAATGRSYRSLQGSPTTPDAQSIADLQGTAQLIGSVLSGNLRGIAGQAWERVWRGVGEKNAAGLVSKLLETNPDAVRGILEAAAPVQQQLGRTARNRSARAIGLTSDSVNTLAGNRGESVERRRYREQQERRRLGLPPAPTNALMGR